MSRRRGSIVLPVGGGGGGGLIPGPRLPLDANTLLAYYCDEDTGGTLANSATGGAYPLTLVGNYLLASKGLFSFGTNATRWPAPGNGAGTYPGTADRAYNSAAVVALPGSCTLECVMTADDVPGTFGAIVAEVTDASRNNGIYIAAKGYDFLQAGVILGGSYFAKNATVNLYASRLHVAAVHNGSTIELFINGVSQGSLAAPGNVGTVTKIAVANSTAAQQPFRGLIAEVRASNVARDAAYCLAATAAANGL